jgi:hypothetical protein
VPLRERLREVVNVPTLRTVVTNRQYRRWYLARLVSLARTRAAVSLSRLGKRTRSSALETAATTNPSRGLILESELARLVTAGNHVEVVYGTLDGNLAQVNGDPAASRAIQLLRDRRPSGLSWTVLDGSVHGFKDSVVQEQLIQLVIEHACELAERAPTAAG